MADSLGRGAEALEDLAAMAGATGLYRLEVTAGEGGSCRYSLRTEGPRDPARRTGSGLKQWRRPGED